MGYAGEETTLSPRQRDGHSGEVQGPRRRGAWAKLGGLSGTTVQGGNHYGTTVQGGNHYGTRRLSPSISGDGLNQSAKFPFANETLRARTQPTVPAQTALDQSRHNM